MTDTNKSSFLFLLGIWDSYSIMSEADKQGLVISAPNFTSLFPPLNSRYSQVTLITPYYPLKGLPVYLE